MDARALALVWDGCTAGDIAPPPHAIQVLLQATSRRTYCLNREDNAMIQQAAAKLDVKDSLLDQLRAQFDRTEI
jgi:hypothetical protein